MRSSTLSECAPLHLASMTKNSVLRHFRFHILLLLPHILLNTSYNWRTNKWARSGNEATPSHWECFPGTLVCSVFRTVSHAWLYVMWPPHSQLGHHVTPTQNWAIMWQLILTQVIRLSLAYPTTTSYDSSVNEAINCLPTFCVPNGELQQSLSVSPDQSASSVWDCKRDAILHLRGSQIVCY